MPYALIHPLMILPGVRLGKANRGGKTSPARGIGMATVDRLKAFLDAFNSHDLDAIMEFFADDCVMETPRGPDPWGSR